MMPTRTPTHRPRRIVPVPVLAADSPGGVCRCGGTEHTFGDPSCRDWDTGAR